jgi:hypothetical protein
MLSFPLALEQSLVSYLQSNITGSLTWPILKGHTDNFTGSFDLPIIAVVCDGYSEEIAGYSVFKADLRVDIVCNAHDSSSYSNFDLADDQIQNLMSDQEGIRSWVNNPSSSMFIAGLFLEGSNNIIGENDNDFINCRRYSVFAQQQMPSSSVIYPQAE